MGIEHSPTAGQLLEKQLAPMLDALRLASTSDLDRSPGRVVIGLGSVILVSVVASKLIRLFGLGIGDLEPIEFIASLAAGVLILAIGAALHGSADRLQGQSAKVISDAAVGFARSFAHPTAPEAGSLPEKQRR